MNQGTDLDKLAVDVESASHAVRLAALAEVLHIHDPAAAQVRTLRRLMDALGQLAAPVDPPASPVPAPTPTKSEVLAALEKESDVEALSTLTARLASFTGEDVLEAAIALTRHKNGRIRANAVEAIAANAQA